MCRWLSMSGRKTLHNIWNSSRDSINGTIFPSAFNLRVWNKSVKQLWKLNGKLHIWLRKLMMNRTFHVQCNLVTLVYKYLRNGVLGLLQKFWAFGWVVWTIAYRKIDKHNNFQPFARLFSMALSRAWVNGVQLNGVLNAFSFFWTLNGTGQNL